ncbi:hypothetical protein BX600DRAFT_195786 [Xylariales sp. PMI_506]|nr:hypothetical protein BX600DRAFT_195786 [Xylariales sp. PMI_506]
MMMNRSILFLVAAAAAGISSAAAATTTTSTAATASDATSSISASGKTTTATKSSTSGPATHTVTVGINNAYNPNSITADVGDTVLFKFYPTNHSVVEAAFENPCIPYNYVYTEAPSIFFSGNYLVDAGETTPTWSLLINDTDPHFFYCDAPGSCVTDAMLGVINPNSTWTLARQQAAQKNVTFQLGPGQAWPAEQPSPTAAGSGATSTTTTTAAATNTPESKSTLSGGAIAGIAIGGAALLLIGVAMVWFCGRRGGIEKGYRKSTIAHPAGPAPMIEVNYEDTPKSPPHHNSSLLNSPYGTQHSETYRTPSPAQWSQTGSPHNSYMQGYPSPGLQSPYSDVFRQSQTGQPYDQNKPPGQEEHGPAELPAHPSDVPFETRHEFPA